MWSTSRTWMQLLVCFGSLMAQCTMKTPSVTLETTGYAAESREGANWVCWCNSCWWENKDGYFLLLALWTGALKGHHGIQYIMFFNIITFPFILFSHLNELKRHFIAWFKVTYSSFSYHYLKLSSYPIYYGTFNQDFQHNGNLLALNIHSAIRRAHLKPITLTLWITYAIIYTLNSSTKQ